MGCAGLPREPSLLWQAEHTAAVEAPLVRSGLYAAGFFSLAEAVTAAKHNRRADANFMTGTKGKLEITRFYNCRIWQVA
jgi:hypothetical protein